MRANLIILFVLFLIVPSASNAQIGKLKDKLNKKIKSKTESVTNVLPDAAKEKLNEELNSKINNARSKYDSTSFSYAISLNDNAAFYESRDLGRSLLTLSPYLVEAEEDIDDLDNIRTKLEFGEMAYASQKFRLAENTFLSTIELIRKKGYTEHPFHARALANTGLLYNSMGRFTSAEEYTLSALEKREVEGGQGLFATLNNYAVILRNTGRYNESEKTFDRVIDLQGKESTPEMFRSITLNNKAVLLQTMGNIKGAMELMEQALGIAGEEIREKSPNYQRMMGNLALMYQEDGQLEKAEEVFLKAKELYENRIRVLKSKSKDPDYAHLLSNLASVYLDMDKRSEVESLLKESVEIYKNSLGEASPAYANAIHDLGTFYRLENRLEQAGDLLKTAYEINLKTLGESHPSSVQTLEEIALWNWQIGEHQEAYENFREALDKTMEFITTYFPPMSEAEKTHYWDLLSPRFQHFYVFVTDRYSETPELASDMFNYLHHTKGILLESTSRIRSRILSSGDEETKILFRTWLDQKEMLSRYYSYSREELRAEKVNIDSLETATNFSEKTLSEKSEDFRNAFEVRGSEGAKALRELSDGEVLVEIVRLRTFENGRLSGQSRYVAMVASNTGIDNLVSIGSGDELENRYFKYYRNAIRQKITDEYSYDKYWKAVDEKLKNPAKVFLVSDGIFNQLNINTFRRPDGSFVVDHKNIQLLGSSRGIMEAGKETVSGKSIVMIGNPRFGAGVDPLPGTKKELDLLRQLFQNAGWKSEIRTEDLATEENVKSTQNPGILHIATHGYFLKDDEIREERVMGVHLDNALRNPMLRSGLMFTGASSADGGGEGILTAFESMNLWLDKSGMVVLSACETGLGDVKAGEGVYGLQRAFFAAGAGGLVMSLWKVNDQTTQELMVSFYRNYLGSGDKLSAFRDAQLALKKKYPEPYYWGAFVMLEK